MAFPASSSARTLRRCLQGLRLSTHASSSSYPLPAATRPFASSRSRAAIENQDPPASTPASSSPSSDPSTGVAAEETSTPARTPRSNRTRSKSDLLAEDAEQDGYAFTNPRTATKTASAKEHTSVAGSGNAIAPPMNFNELASFPSILYTSHPVLDGGEVTTVPPTAGAPWGATVTIYNDTKHFRPSPRSAADIAQGDVASAEGAEAEVVEKVLAEETPLSASEIRKFHRHVLQTRRVVHMTGKGKIQSMSTLIVVGNGKGMVGFGTGNDENAGAATQKAYKDAVKSMDFVKRFENRTIHRSIVGEWGATKVYMRPRPPGFGLRVPPSVHAIARSSGITDLSASITGSTNPVNVCRAVLSALFPGAGPTGMGNGLGGSARRRDRGEGPKTLEDIEVERGRRYRVVRS